MKKYLPIFIVTVLIITIPVILIYSNIYIPLISPFLLNIGLVKTYEQKISGGMYKITTNFPQYSPKKVETYTAGKIDQITKNDSDDITGLALVGEYGTRKIIFGSLPILVIDEQHQLKDETYLQPGMKVKAFLTEINGVEKTKKVQVYAE